MKIRSLSTTTPNLGSADPASPLHCQRGYPRPHRCPLLNIQRGGPACAACPGEILDTGWVYEDGSSVSSRRSEPGDFQFARALRTTECMAYAARRPDSR